MHALERPEETITSPLRWCGDALFDTTDDCSESGIAMLRGVGEHGATLPHIAGPETSPEQCGAA